MSRELKSFEERNAAAHLCNARHPLPVQDRDPETVPCPTCRADIMRLMDAPPRERVPEEASPLAWLLCKAVLAPNEDGDILLLFLNLWGEWEEERGLMIASADGETSEEPFTAEDVPFLTDEQRAHINGTTTHARGYIDDLPTIIKAVEYCAAQNRRKP